MSRCFFTLLTVGSAAALAAALMFPPAPAALKIGVVDSDSLFNRQPDVVTLRKVEAAGRRAPGNFGAFLHAADTGLSENDILRSEWDMARLGMIDNDGLIVSFWSDRIFSDLQRDSDSIFAGRAESGKSDFAAAREQLETAYDAIAADKTGTVSFADEKWRLMNLQLKLRVLTRDPYVMPDYRLAGIQDEIISLKKTISAAEKAREEERAKMLGKEAAKVRKNFSLKSKSDDEEVGRAAREKLEAAEKLLAGIVRGHRTELQKRLRESKLTRRLASNEIWNPGREANAGIEPAGDIYNVIEKGLRVEFDRRLRRKAFAVAERRKIAVILDTPYPAGARAVDVGGEF
jgi:hypothetical protein